MEEGAKYREAVAAVNRATDRQIDEAMDVNSPEAKLWAENMRLKSENEHLRALLKPFAEAAWDDLADESDAVPVSQKRNTYTITNGDVRRARAALET